MADDERPDLAVGHISIGASSVAESSAFYIGLGMREIVTNDEISVLELRGGTHLVVREGEIAEVAPFDLMVDDIDVAHDRWTAAGHEVTDIRRGHIHDSFDIVDPAGTRVIVNSSHAVGAV